MKRVFTFVFLAGALLVSASVAGAPTAAGSPAAKRVFPVADIAPHSFKPDQEFLQAVMRNDTASLARLLDDDLTWTDAAGRTLTKAQILANLPMPALGDENQSSGEDQMVNRQLAIHRAERGNVYVLRVWVKHATGWRALVYQEVKTSLAPSENSSEAQACENPCNSVPFAPKSEDEREVIEAYQSVERSVTAHDSAAWGSHMDDAFFAVTSNSDRPVNKQARMAGLDRQKEGAVPARLRTHVPVWRRDGHGVAPEARARQSHSRDAHLEQETGQMARSFQLSNDD